MGSKSLWDIRPYRETMAAFERAASLGGDRSLSVISAVGGSGKSYCAQRFAQERREHVLVEVPCRALIERSVRVLLDIIAANLAVRSTGNTSRLEIADRIAVNLRKRGGMLMVDEADQLLVRYVDVLRSISMASGQPVCFIGTPSVEGILARSGPVATRVAFRFRINRATVEDLLEMFPRTYSKEAYEEIIDITGGNLRLIASLWDQLADVKREIGYEGVTPEAVRATASEFLLGGGVMPLGSRPRPGVALEDARGR